MEQVMINSNGQDTEVRPTATQSPPPQKKSVLPLCGVNALFSVFGALIISDNQFANKALFD